jgi:hypothetical protein
MCGLARLVGGPEHISKGSLEFAQVEPDPAYAIIKRWARDLSITALIYERYWLYPWAVKKGFDELPAPQVIGVLKYLHTTDPRIKALEVQNASVMKAAFAKCRAKGLEPIFGDAFQRRTKYKDMSAAEMHLLWYLFQHGMVPKTWAQGDREIAWVR